MALPALTRRGRGAGSSGVELSAQRHTSLCVQGRSSGSRPTAPPFLPSWHLPCLPAACSYLWHLHGRHGEGMEAEDLGAIVANHKTLKFPLVHREVAGLDVEVATA